MKIDFTKKSLVGLSPDPERNVNYFDSSTPGLCLCVTKKGIKTFYTDSEQIYEFPIAVAHTGILIFRGNCKTPKKRSEANGTKCPCMSQN
jgi:hypothetical protein